MGPKARRKLMIGVALAAILTGGIVAAVTAARPVGHGNGSGRAHTLLATSSAYLGLPIPSIRRELNSGESLAEIANHTPGKSSAGLVDALFAARRAHLSALEARAGAQITALVDRPGGPARPRGGPLAAAAAYLAVSEPALHRDLRSGMTLAEVAERTPGHSEAGLVAAIVASRTQALAAREASGKLTASADARRVAHLEERVTALVHRTRRKTSPGAPSAVRG